MKRVFFAVATGFLLGAFLGIFIPLVIPGDRIVSAALLERTGSLKTAILLQVLLPGLYGAGTMSGTLLYDSDRLTVPAATLIHYAICVGPFVPLALFLGWFGEFTSMLPFLAIQLAAFFFIWLIIFLIGRREVSKLNRLQRKLNGEGKSAPQSETEKGENQ